MTKFILINLENGQRVTCTGKVSAKRVLRNVGKQQSLNLVRVEHENGQIESALQFLS